MAREVVDNILHPEGLSPAQEALADMLFDYKIEAKVRRRLGNEGNYTFETVIRPTSPIDFAQPGEFALKLHEKHPEAPLSPVYINLRNLPPELLDQVGVAMAGVDIPSLPDYCVGIPSAGDPIAEVYSSRTGIGRAELLRKEVGEGGRKIVPLESGEPLTGSVRLVDDLITQADTKLEAIQAIESFGLVVSDIVVLVDREQGGGDQLREAGYNLYSAFTMQQMLDFYLRSEKIDDLQYEDTMQGLEQLNQFLGIG